MSVKTVNVELPAEIFDVETNIPLIHQVVVEFDALLAGNAPQHDDDRLVRLLRLGKRFGQVVIDPEAGRFDLGLVGPHLFFARRCGHDTGCVCNRAQ